MKRDALESEELIGSEAKQDVMKNPPTATALLSSEKLGFISWSLCAFAFLSNHKHKKDKNNFKSNNFPVLILY